MKNGLHHSNPKSIWYNARRVRDAFLECLPAKLSMRVACCGPFCRTCVLVEEVSILHDVKCGLRNSRAGSEGEEWSGNLSQSTVANTPSVGGRASEVWSRGERQS